MKKCPQKLIIEIFCVSSFIETINDNLFLRIQYPQAHAYFNVLVPYLTG